MVTTRVAAAFFLVMSLDLPAQRPAQGHLKIQVTDQTSARVPGANIEIDPPTAASKSPIKTDTKGEAQVDLPAGSYTISIACSGFATFRNKFVIRASEDEPLIAMLYVGQISFGGPPVGSPVDIPLEPLSISYAIPSHPLQNLTLSTKTSKRHPL